MEPTASINVSLELFPDGRWVITTQSSDWRGHVSTCEEAGPFDSLAEVLADCAGELTDWLDTGLHEAKVGAQLDIFDVGSC